MLEIQIHNKIYRMTSHLDVWNKHDSYNPHICEPLINHFAGMRVPLKSHCLHRPHDQRERQLN